MRAHWEQEKRERAERGYTRRQAHMMGPDQVMIKRVILLLDEELDIFPG